MRVPEEGDGVRGKPNNPVTCSQCGSPYGCEKDKRCNPCRLKSMKHRIKYRWTPEVEAAIRRVYEQAHDKNSLSEGLSKLSVTTGIPKHNLRIRAQVLGVTVDTRRPWTEKELKYLRDYAGELDAHVIAKRLCRSWESVKAKINRLSMSYRVEREGYTYQDLKQVFGVSFETIKTWERKSLLRAWGDRFTEASVVDFAKKNPQLYSLKRVDEWWFKQTVIGAQALEQREAR